MPVYLHGLATALPPHELPQTLVRQIAAEILGPKYPAFKRLSASFDSAGIDMRYSVVPPAWFEGAHGWHDRNAAYLEGAQALFVEAARRALGTAQWEAHEVDCIVTVSSTGIATPSLEARAMGEMGFRPDIRRMPVFGLGCAGGVSGLSIAQSMSAARPDDKVLLVVVEACTPAFRSDRAQKADIIATVLFGDGAAAACLQGRAPEASRMVRLGQGTQKTWPDTLDIMGWEVDDTGLGVVFDRSIPNFVLETLEEAATEALTAANLSSDQIDRFVCHPGGAKVITAIETALHLEQGALQAERDVLRAAGNMSAPTVLFVLERVLREGSTGQMMATALGPGFSAAFLPFEVAA
ncbi:chalcone synthase [Thioclava dalianensis]|uniref:Chalcone synthase n=1 Tax=Thioclava dalianensis TaxID=1185766 RepID=A0A074TC42_9RHOB|nr:3-oxoacyl-[acyl-carrier-protein] synthase III C-terminal domain-containing protein [Thioclava dalianensis]KEP69346.1 chalcone synthase [Thioclava dalianensis]SFN57369.1 alkylresorcinol/alkylpyrone synthase [Thioclava dalianensis]